MTNRTRESVDSPSLLERLGVAEHAEPMEPLLERLAATGRVTWDRLGAADQRHPKATPPELDIPHSYRQVLRAALALERAEPDAENPERAEQIRAHYLDVMPAYRVRQLATSEAPNAFLFNEPLDWSRLPRLRGALDRFSQLLASAGVPDELALGPGGRRGLERRYETLGELYADTYFGCFLPFLYGFPGDLAAYQRELEATGDPWAVFDRRLAAPIIHELMHGRRSRDAIFPPYLDECLAGYLGIHVLPELAYPAPGADNALFSSPWFGQVGQALVRAFGWRDVLRAHFGVEPWREALPAATVDAIEALGWSQYRAAREPHFLIGNTRPEPWIRLFYLGAAGELPESGSIDESSLSAVPFAELPVPCGADDDDRASGDAHDAGLLERLMLEHALLAMCLRNSQSDGAYRVERVCPDAAITIDFEVGHCRRDSAPNSLDIAAPRYTLPPALAARYREAGAPCWHLRLHDVGAIGAAVDALVDSGAPPPQSSSGFELVEAG